MVLGAWSWLLRYKLFYLLQVPAPSWPSFFKVWRYRTATKADTEEHVLWLSWRVMARHGLVNVHLSGCGYLKELILPSEYWQWKQSDTTFRSKLDRSERRARLLLIVLVDLHQPEVPIVGDDRLFQRQSPFPTSGDSRKYHRVFGENWLFPTPTLRCMSCTDLCHTGETWCWQHTLSRFLHIRSAKHWICRTRNGCHRISLQSFPNSIFDLV